MLLAAPACAQSSDTAILGADRCDAQTRHAIIVHGGTSSGKLYPERLAFIEDMLAARRAELERGDKALDVATRAIVAMEDSGLFNAGKGAISNLGGFVETDASIMDGRTQDAGSVASLLTIKNPILAARTAMEDTSHVMFVGDRGEAKLTSMGLETVEADYFSNNMKNPKTHGTVGAAVLDRCGDLAAGTSTGGYDNKTPGRVGDSPIIGAGVWAQNGVMAGSATGHGEYYIRYNALRSVAARMEFGDVDIVSATEAVLVDMAQAGKRDEPDGRAGQGGIIAVDADGNFGAVHSYFGMIHGMARDDMAPVASQSADGSPIDFGK
jgi:beta-aspartyl-peptidase (threonine type)